MWITGVLPTGRKLEEWSKANIKKCSEIKLNVILKGIQDMRKLSQNDQYQGISW